MFFYVYLPFHLDIFWFSAGDLLFVMLRSYLKIPQFFLTASRIFSKRNHPSLCWIHLWVRFTRCFWCVVKTWGNAESSWRCGWSNLAFRYCLMLQKLPTEKSMLDVDHAICFGVCALFLMFWNLTFELSLGNWDQMLGGNWNRNQPSHEFCWAAESRASNFGSTQQWNQSIVLKCPEYP